ncbi:hypothetical protein [Xanthomonas phaseoli]|uniref:Secreted protein n=1 Tax=Xanthomonas manihotis TaxID=43353 RepID=A0A8I1XP32_XANMN|nr:hypothetical protein [Xanthomonas phaseoli]RWU20361.1 hypothetical protein XANMN_01260 [Xanthomonas phaseoli pv. manihotis str. CIO151]KUF37075.1 hypothetical protein AO826_19355 [Xanthomonas phaseoli pv. manihotis]MBO9721838.1 hypothetical protein [Xanthomonas phaseoli pv. manihotis]MBO9755214.1 hypothetical protein [Xanthomonas phaseoli pv. manihotis]MBO9761827.1 hypothetical protein [Xanthomonas phaseoli pv. manihotis]
MKTQTLRIALSTALLAGATLAGLAQATGLTTLETVQVRPAADQIAQQTVERNSDIRTLTAVQVRPSAEQVAALAAEQAGPRIVTLAAVQVRPSAEQRADLVVRSAAVSAHSVTGQAAGAIGALMGQVIVNLPTPQLQPSPAELEALVNAAISL